MNFPAQLSSLSIHLSCIFHVHVAVGAMSNMPCMFLNFELHVNFIFYIFSSIYIYMYVCALCINVFVLEDETRYM